MTVFCTSYNFLGATFFEKLKNVVDAVYKVDFIAFVNGAPYVLFD